MRQLISTLVLLLLLPLYQFAQTAITTQPRVSQASSISQTLGLSTISIDYHRPAVRERQIWGELIPYGTVWRAGANENTLITFSHEVSIEGKKVPAGKYGLHLEPQEKEAVLILSKATNGWGSSSYRPDEDVLRVTIPAKASDHFYELMTFTFSEVDATSTTAALQWADRQYLFRIQVDVAPIVVASLREELRSISGFNWQAWNEAATYCLQNEVNLAEALGWAQRSVFMQPNPANIDINAQLAAKLNGEGKEAREQELRIGTWESVLTGYPVTWREWHAGAQICQQLKELEKSQEWMAQSVKMNPNMTNLMAQSQLYADQGEEKKAKELRAEAIRRGSNAELNNYGYQLLFGGNPAGAVEVFEANAQKNPTDPNVWDSLGEGYIGNNQPQKAIESLKKSLSLNPIPGVRANSIRLLHQLGVNVEEDDDSNP